MFAYIYDNETSTARFNKLKAMFKTKSCYHRSCYAKMREITEFFPRLKEYSMLPTFIRLLSKGNTQEVDNFSLQFNITSPVIMSLYL